MQLSDACVPVTHIEMGIPFAECAERSQLKLYMCMKKR